MFHSFKKGYQEYMAKPLRERRLEKAVAILFTIVAGILVFFISIGIILFGNGRQWKLVEESILPMVLQEAPESQPTNSSGTLFEATLDALSGDLIPYAAYSPQASFICDGTPEMANQGRGIVACVNTTTPWSVQVSQGYIDQNQRDRETFIADGDFRKLQGLNALEAFSAAHEFAHILQYNYPEETKKWEEQFTEGRRGKTEHMADCYASTIVDVTAKLGEGGNDALYDQEELDAYNNNLLETTGNCSPVEKVLIKDWLEDLGYPEFGWGDLPNLATWGTTEE